MLEVYITVDTECSMGGAWDVASWEPVPPERAILGKIGSQHYGTPLIMDILEQHGLRATFFIETLVSEVVPKAQIADAYGELKRRGHDPQLHLHPVYHYYSLFRQGEIRREQLPPNMDLIGSLPLETQLYLLKKGTCLFRKFVASNPVAFRAGNFGASVSTFSALSKLGFRYDSSFNAAFVGRSCLIEYSSATNRPWEQNGVWEVPITNFETGAWRMRGLKPLDVGAISFIEMRRVLEQAESLGLQAVVFLMHSFTLFKKADVQFRRLQPDHLVIRRFRELCNFLAKGSLRFKVMTFADKPNFTNSASQDSVPRIGSFLPACRKLVQAFNRVPWF
jgi:hypothetical protein